MADAVKTHVLLNTGDSYIAIFTNISDGSGENAVVKVDHSALTDLTGRLPGRLRIMGLEWAIQGFPYVKIAFDATTDDTALVLAGNGEMCFDKLGGIKNPATTGYTDDIVFTAPAGAGTGSYTILLRVAKN